MSELSNKDVHKFWSEYYNPMIYKAISFMENVEDWTLDGDQELEQAITKLGTALDDAGYIDLEDEDKIIQILSYVKTGRMLRLLQCMDIAHHGAASKILMFAKNASQSANDVFGIFLRRNIVFERLCILGRVFAADRINDILQAIGDQKNV